MPYFQDEIDAAARKVDVYAATRTSGLVDPSVELNHPPEAVLAQFLKTTHNAPDAPDHIHEVRVVPAWVTVSQRMSKWPEDAGN